MGTFLLYFSPMSSVAFWWHFFATEVRSRFRLKYSLILRRDWYLEVSYFKCFSFSTTCVTSSTGSSSSSMAGSGGGQSFGNAKQDLVYKMVSACTRDEGLQRDEV